MLTIKSDSEADKIISKITLQIQDREIREAWVRLVSLKRRWQQLVLFIICLVHEIYVVIKIFRDQQAVSPV